MWKFSKLVIKNNDEVYCVYDEDTQDRIDLFPKDEQGVENLLSYVKYLLEKDED